MGSKLSVEEALCLAINDLGVEQTHVHCWRSNNTIKTICLVEEKWLQDLHDHGVYSKPQCYPGTNYERFLLLQPSNEEVPKPWTRVSLKILRKPLKEARKPCGIKDDRLLEDDLFVDLMSYVSTENYKNYLLQASKKYSTTPSSNDTKTDVISGEDVILYLAKLVYNLKIVKLNNGTATVVKENLRTDCESFLEENQPLPEETLLELSERRFTGMVSVYGILENDNAYFVVEPFMPHSLQDVVWFSPSVLSSTTAKPLFLLYQVLKLFETFHGLNYYCTVNSVHDILMHKSLWLFISTTNANLGEMIPDEPVTGNGNPLSDSVLSYARVGSFEIPIPVKLPSLPVLTDMWVKKELSNFDYLMALNMLAGRRIGDPNYHPVLPWVTDFTRPKGNFRDLTKSKFRINKGDHQLDLTYQGAQLSDLDGDLADNAPHHVSGVLSEITYHVYLARRTPKNVLQKHVRAKWEPNEYPSNMQRLQEWTPDECIPEFYADPTIFKSIHADLPDLDVPMWASSSDEFIRLHREALESEYVCSQLNHWIDLTFGCMLVGAAAVKAKNVYLHLVDHHETINNHGVLQLFHEPHPSQRRHHEMVLYPSTVNFDDGLEYDMNYVSKQDEDPLGTVEELAEVAGKERVPSSSWDNVDVGVKLETGEDELNASANAKKQRWGRHNLSAFLRLKDVVETTADITPTIDSLPISLPIGYDPMEEFEQVQLLTKFKMQSKEHDLAFAAAALPLYNEGKVLARCDIPETARHQEIQNLCSMLMEMFLPARMRLLSNDLSQKEKFIAAKRVFSAGKVAVAGVLRDGFKILFDEGCGFHKRQGLPPLTPELLLQPYANVFPFPSYFKRLHYFLTDFHLEARTHAAGFFPDKSHETSWARLCIANQGSCRLRQVEIAVKHLPELLSDLNEEGLDILMTYLNPLFCHEETQLQSFLHLFDPLATRLGPKKARKIFFKLLLKQYDVRMSDSSVPLFHQSFISKLIVRFGLEQFLSHFITFIVDALNLSTTKDGQVNVDTSSQDEVHGVILEDEKEPEKETVQVMETKQEPCDKKSRDEEDVKSTNSDSASLQGLGSNVEGQLGVNERISCDVIELTGSEKMNVDLEVTQKTSNHQEAGDVVHLFEDNEVCGSAAGVDEVMDSLIADDKAVASDEEQEDEEEETVERCEVDGTARSLGKSSAADDWFSDENVDSEFSLERSVSFVSDNLEEEGTIVGGDDVHCEVEISEAAAESLCWLAPRLGPLLTSNYITKPLLQMLIKCYVGVVSMGDRGAPVGDGNAKWILHCLGRFTEIYGEQVIIHQYLPFVASKINIVSELVSLKSEANLAGALVLVRHCVLYISKSSLLQQFEVICYQFLDQVLCLLSSDSISFASGAMARTFLALLVVEVLKIVCDILERDSAQALLSSLIETFFSIFNKAFGIVVPPGSPGASSTQEATLEVQPYSKEIQDTFTASLAYHAYITLCKSLGDTYMEATLCNYEMIWLLCCSMDKGLSNHTPPTTSEAKVVLPDEEQQAGVVASDAARAGMQATNKRMAENSSLERNYPPSIEMKKDASVGNAERSTTFTIDKSSFVSSRQHLTGNWLKYWKHHLGKRNRNDKQSFSQLKLQTFTGHMDGIKDLYVQDSEHLFLSASKDKTVKLWSLSNHGDGTGQSASSWTAYEHRRSVFAIDVVDVMRQAVSCDGSVHIWDLATGSSVVRLNFPKSNQAVAMTTLPSPSSCVVAAMQNASVRFIDARKGDFVHTWKVTSNSLAGTIRSMCVNREGTWMAVGFSGGSVSLIDLRGGILSKQWKAHETDVIQVKPFTNSSLISLSSTQKMHLWNVDHDGVVASIPTGVAGSGESIQNICVHDKAIVSTTSNNRVGWHMLNDIKEPTYSSVRLGNDVFKGNLTCFGVLPLNRGYLFGSDNGNITLMA